MKKLNYLLSTVVLLAVLVTIGCSKDDGPSVTPEEAVTARFAKTWTITSATLTAEGDVTTDFTGLTLTITDAKGYSTNSASVSRDPNPWPASGLWEFKSEITDAAAGSFVVTRDSELDINVTLTDTSLTLSFNFDATEHSGSGKDEAVDGDWVFVFAAQ